MWRVLLVFALALGACKAPAEAPTIPRDTGRAAILAAYEAKRSKVWVEFDAEVVKTLPDDEKGSRHQRFIVDVGRHTVLVAHNIDLAARVDVKRGTQLRVRGRYEYNDKGGVVHWTHADPKRKRAGGWIRVSDRPASRGR